MPAGCVGWRGQRAGVRLRQAQRALSLFFLLAIDHNDQSSFGEDRFLSCVCMLSNLLVLIFNYIKGLFLNMKRLEFNRESNSIENWQESTIESYDDGINGGLKKM